MCSAARAERTASKAAAFASTDALTCTRDGAEHQMPYAPSKRARHDRGQVSLGATTRLGGLALLIMLAGPAACDRSNETTTPERASKKRKTKTVRALPGAHCETRADCLRHSPCQYGTCELPGPCSVSGVRRGVKEEGTHRYDDELREVEATYRQGTTVVRHRETEWSRDGRHATQRTGPADQKPSLRTTFSRSSTTS